MYESFSKNYWAPYIYAISSNLLFILAQLIAKLQMSIVSPMFIIYYRSIIILGFNSFLICNENRKIKREILKQTQEGDFNKLKLYENLLKPIQIDIIEQNTFRLMIKRVLFACLSMACYTISLKNIQLSITNALFQTGPIFAFFIDAFVSKIKILRIHLLLTLLSFLGVVFILWPEEKSHNQNGLEASDSGLGLLPYLLPIGAAFTSACSMSYLHKLKEKVHPLLTIQYLSLGAMITSGLLFNFQANDTPDPTFHQTHSNPSTFTTILSPLFILSTVTMSFLVLLSQYLRVRSLFILPASKVAPLHYFGIILSIVFDLLIFGYSIKWYQYVGMGLASSGLLMKILVERNEMNEKRRSSQDQMSKF